jgi:hypothetical protein
MGGLRRGSGSSWGGASTIAVTVGQHRATVGQRPVGSPADDIPLLLVNACAIAHT